MSTAEQWRAWLRENHSRRKEAWVVYGKKGKEVLTISYDQSVEEALCFGWVDSVLRKIDDDFYERRFTPRRIGSNWAESNLLRARKLIASGKMEPAGYEVLPKGCHSIPSPRRSGARSSSV